MAGLKQISETGRCYAILNADMTEEYEYGIDDLKTAKKLIKEEYPDGIIMRSAWEEYDGGAAYFAYGKTFAEAERKLRKGDVGF